MKIRSLLLGSVATVGLTTAGFATDLGVVTSLNVCDELGLSGLTISSDDNCLVITGEVSYEFTFGDWDGTSAISGWFDRSGHDITIPWGDGGDNDWSSSVDYWLQFVASADSTMGLATATIKLSGSNGDIGVDEAFITIGDTTMLTAGMTGSIFNGDDDEPLNFLGLFNSDDVDAGVGTQYSPATGGHVIQLVTDLGSGVWLGGGLEDLNGGGTAVGVISYSGDGFTAHASVAAGGVLDGAVDGWMVHTGFTGTMDNFKFVGAAAMDDGGWWNVLGSASATFDMFTLAGSVEATSNEEYGVGASLGATVADGITLNVGGRFFHNDPWFSSTDDITQVAAQIVASVSDDVTVTGEVGGYFTPAGGFMWSNASEYYVKGQVDWAPGGGVDASVSAEANTNGAWQTDFSISKSIK